ncbi:MAG: ammonium transporter, partial [Desulfovibrionaceae bacterium]
MFSRLTHSGLLKSLGALALVLVPAVALAQDAAPAVEAPEYLTQFHGDLLWTLLTAVLVMFMQAGFACVECGFTRAKSAGNIIMKNFLDFAAGQPIFFLLGFGLMFGAGSGFIGHSHFGLFDVADADMPWGVTFWFFQSVFAATSATIVSGGIAERTKFGSYIILSCVVSGIIYPISGHWAWGSLYGDAGWLESTFSAAFCDFAGSSVVHSVGGW